MNGREAVSINDPWDDSRVQLGGWPIRGGAMKAAATTIDPDGFEGGSAIDPIGNPASDGAGLIDPVGVDGGSIIDPIGGRA